MDIKDININMHADDEYLDQLPIMLKGILQAFTEANDVSKSSVHEYHELTYVRSGQLDYIIKGKRYTLVAGSTIVVKPNVPHSYVVVEECEIACVYLAYNSQESKEDKENGNSSGINIDPYIDFLSYSDQKDTKEHDDEENPFRYAMMLEGKGRREIAAIVEQILLEDNQEEFGNILMLQALTLQLLIQFSRALKAEYEERKNIRTGKAKELVRIAKDYLDNNYDRNISMAELANHVYLSPGYFARAFRETIGDSPMTYLLKVRVENACVLLEQSDVKISTICKWVGFSSPLRFNSAFKKFKNLTPMDYRRSYRENQE